MKRLKFWVMLLATLAVVAVSAAFPSLLFSVQDAKQTNTVEQQAVDKVELSLLPELSIYEKLSLLSGVLGVSNASSVSQVALETGRQMTPETAISTFLESIPAFSWQEAAEKSTVQVGYCVPFLLVDNQYNPEKSVIIWNVSFSSDLLWGNAWMDDETGKVLSMEMMSTSTESVASAGSDGYYDSGTANESAVDYDTDAEMVYSFGWYLIDYLELEVDAFLGPYEMGGRYEGLLDIRDSHGVALMVHLSSGALSFMPE